MVNSRGNLMRLELGGVLKHSKNMPKRVIYFGILRYLVINSCFNKLDSHLIGLVRVSKDEMERESSLLGILIILVFLPPSFDNLQMAQLLFFAGGQT